MSVPEAVEIVGEIVKPFAGVIVKVREIRKIYAIFKGVFKIFH